MERSRPTILRILATFFPGRKLAFIWPELADRGPKAMPSPACLFGKGFDWLLDHQGRQIDEQVATAHESFPH